MTNPKGRPADYSEQYAGMDGTPYPSSTTASSEPADNLRATVFSVLEGFALPPTVRKILEAAYYAEPQQSIEAEGAAPHAWAYRRYGSPPEKGYTIVAKHPGITNGEPIAFLGDGDVASAAAQAICDAHNASVLAHSIEQQAPIAALVAEHARLIEEGNNYAYFELAYTRSTGWMAWITDKPLAYVVESPDRKVLFKGQGDSPEAACRSALKKPLTFSEAGLSRLAAAVKGGAA